MNQASCKWKKALIGAVPAMGLLMIGTASVAADPKGKLPQTAYLPQEMALQAATTALEQCRADGYSVSVAVVDRAGVLLALVRDPTAGPHTIGSSQGKAFTSASTGQITANKVKAYAVTTPERVKSLPDLKTTAELGMPQLQVSVWHGLYAPKGTPQAIVQKLTDALKKALADQAVVDQMAKLGTAPVPADDATPQAHREYLDEQLKTWAKIIADAGVKAT